MDVKSELLDTGRYIVIGLILAIALNFGLGLVLGAEKPVMAVVSSSMEPTFSKGDLVVIKGVEPEDVKVGDIIVYYNPFKHIPVVHRVVAIEEIDGKLYFITKGDNNLTNPYPDQDPRVMLAPPVSEQYLRGKVVFWIPKVGWVKVLFTELAAKYGLVKVLLLVLLLFITFGMVEDYIKERKKSSS